MREVVEAAETGRACCGVPCGASCYVDVAARVPSRVYCINRTAAPPKTGSWNTGLDTQLLGHAVVWTSGMC